MSSHDKKKRNWKKILFEELVEYWINVGYLAVVFAAFTQYRRIILAAHDITYTNYWVAVIEALILAKVIMIGAVLRLGRGLEQKPLIYPTLYKTVIFTIFVAVFTLAEHAIKGLWQGKGLMGGIDEYFEKGLHEFIAGCLMLFVAFIPFFGVKELGRVLGKEKIGALFFRKRADQDDQGGAGYECENPSDDGLTRTMLAVLFIGALIAACFWILLPFLNAFLWATTLVVTTWPLMLGLQARLGGKRGLAVTVATVFLLMVVIVPLSLAVAAIISKADDIAAWGKSMGSFTMPPPPDWVRGIPIAGSRVADAWQQYAALPPDELSARLTPYARKALTWFSSRAGTGLMMFLQFLLTVIISAILYAKGEAAAAGVRHFARRLAGQKGVDMVILSGKTIRSVAMGIVVTALIQTSIGGIGLIIVGVPFPGLLMALMFMLGLAQVGSAPVLIPAVIWVYSKDGALWGTILLAVSIVSLSIDNVIRPLLIKKGADLPLIMIFAGVIGGLLAFGILGLFIGPIVLAVSYTLLESWVLGNGQEEAAGEGEGETRP